MDFCYVCCSGLVCCEGKVRASALTLCVDECVRLCPSLARSLGGNGSGSGRCVSFALSPDRIRPMQCAPAAVDATQWRRQRRRRRQLNGSLRHFERAAQRHWPNPSGRRAGTRTRKLAPTPRGDRRADGRTSQLQYEKEGIILARALALRHCVRAYHNTHALAYSSLAQSMSMAAATAPSSSC